MTKRQAPNTPTAYEIVVRHENGRAFLLAYSERVTRGCLWANVAHYGEAIVAACGLPTDAQCTIGKTGGRPSATSGDWVITYSGRTKRECFGHELPHVNTQAAQVAA